MSLRGLRPALAAVVAAAALAPSAHAGAPGLEVRDVSALTGLGGSAHTYGTTVADWNGDGWDDALVNLHYDSFPQLFLNESGQFQNAYSTAFPSRPRKRDYHGCAAADVDLNGRADLYCTVGGKRGGNGSNPKELWLQGTNGVFAEAPRAWGAADPFGRGRQAAFIYANDDPLADLYVTNQQPRQDGKRGQNRLFLNVSGRRFRSVPGYGLDRRLGGSIVQPVDFDLDGRQDLLLCSQKGLRLYRNIGGHGFTAITKRVRATGPCARGVILAAVNDDQRPDLVRAFADRIEVRLQGPFGRLAKAPVFTYRVGRVRALALGDVNADSIPDIYALRANPFDPNVPRDEQVDAPDVLLASNGTPQSFERVAMPQVTRGIGESVTPIDHDRNGQADFVVMNGKLKAVGPIRLIASYPAP